MVFSGWFWKNRGKKILLTVLGTSIQGFVRNVSIYDIDIGVVKNTLIQTGMITEEEEEWIQHSLKEAERRKCISKILKMECAEAVAKGNNYVSDIYRLTIKVITNSGEIENRSAIYKTIPGPGDKFQDAKEVGIFKLEGKMYMETLHEMGKLLQKKEPGSELLWPEFYGLKGNYDGYLMEDLAVNGFVLADRLIGLNFDHVALCLKNLAKFHALSSVLLDEGVLDKNDYFSNHFSLLDSLNGQGEQRKAYLLLAKAIEDFWPKEWQSYVEPLKNLDKSLFPDIKKTSENVENVFMTLNHGDFWMNNVLFKYSSPGVPVAIRLLDYQFCHINSPCYDIIFMINSSLRLEYFDRILELLKIYHEYLEKDLKAFGFRKTIPTFEELERDFEKTRNFGYSVTLMLRPCMMNPPTHELAERYNITNEEEKMAFLLSYRYDGEDYLEIMRHTLIEMRSRGLL